MRAEGKVGGAEEVTAVSREAMWSQSCRKETEIARVFKDDWGFMIDPNPPPPRDLEASTTAKYYSHGGWIVRPKSIPALNEFSLKQQKERTFINEMAQENHSIRMTRSQKNTNPMFVTTNSRYGNAKNAFDVYSLQGSRIDSSDVTNYKKIGVPLTEAWGLNREGTQNLARSQTVRLEY